MSHQYLVGTSPFLKRVLIPFWVIRILIMVVEIGIYGLTIGVISASRNDLDRLYDDYGFKSNINGIIALMCVVLTVILLCLILDIVSIVKRAQRKLTPRFFLIVNVIQTTIWLIMFILSMIGAKTALTIGLNIICLLSFVGLLIYAAVIFHQHRKGTLRGVYVQAGSVEAHGMVPQGYPSQSYSASAYPHPTSDQAKYGYGEQPYGAPIPAHAEAQFQQRYS